MGNAAPDTTTIAFNAPALEKAILMEMANETHFKSFSEIVRHGYLEWMKEKFPNYAGRIEQVREMQRREVAGRVKDGAMKRIGNIKRAHAANQVGEPLKSKFPAEDESDARKILKNSRKKKRDGKA